jgi:hypothetical protein
MEWPWQRQPIFLCADMGAVAELTGVGTVLHHFTQVIAVVPHIFRHVAALDFAQLIAVGVVGVGDVQGGVEVVDDVVDLVARVDDVGAVQDGGACTVHMLFARAIEGVVIGVADTPVCRGQAAQNGRVTRATVYAVLHFFQAVEVVINIARGFPGAAIDFRLLHAVAVAVVEVVVARDRTAVLAVFNGFHAAGSVVLVVRGYGVGVLHLPQPAVLEIAVGGGAVVVGDRGDAVKGVHGSPAGRWHRSWP